MEKLMSKISTTTKWIAFSLLLLGYGNAFAAVEVLYKETFETSRVPVDNIDSGNNKGGFYALDSKATISISTDTSKNYGNSLGSIRGTYPAPVGSGGYYIWAGMTPTNRNLNDLYIDFWAKMPSPAKHGLKFVKIFGQNGGNGYSNTTFGLDYTGVSYGGMYCVSYGDGATTGNDTQNIIMFDKTYPAQIGRSASVADVKIPQQKIWAGSNWGTGWHHFRLHVKYNTGTTSANEKADGEYYVEIDGNVYVNAKGLYNRHPSNKPIDHIEFFGWSQSGSQPFELWYDDIIISTGGFTETGPVKPEPPVSPSLIVK
jgi:hypothetical protein